MSGSTNGRHRDQVRWPHVTKRRLCVTLSTIFDTQVLMKRLVTNFKTAFKTTPVSRGNKTPIELFRPPISEIKGDVAGLIRDATPEIKAASEAQPTQ